MNKKRESGIAQIIILLLLIVGLGAGVLLVQKYTDFLPKAAAPKVQPPVAVVPSLTNSTDINTNADLEKALTDLDNTNIEAIDNDLSRNDADAASF